MINTIYNEDHLITLSKMVDNFIDLTITSPPYDDLRDYDGYSFDINKLIPELYRVTKKGGVCVWVTNDKTIKGSESLTSFKQAIAFKEYGWRVHDTMIFKKLNPTPNAGNRYQQAFEYMFVFSKGKPKTSNIKLRPRRNKCNDKRIFRRKKFSRNSKGIFNTNNYNVKEFVPLDNIWEYLVGGGNSSKDKIAFKHPAIFPEQLALDHITSWTNEGDLVYDCFGGSGTTAKMCILSNRNYIISELSEYYCQIAKERINNNIKDGFVIQTQGVIK